jgi:hypothetical protein
MSAQTLSTPPWSPDEDARLRRLTASDAVALEQIAQAFSERTPAAIVIRLRRLGLSHAVDLTDYHRSRYRRYRTAAATNRRWTRWSPQEDALLRQAAESRISFDELQRRLSERTAVAIVTRLRALGLADQIAGTQPYYAAWAATRGDRPRRRPPTRRRPCLHCRQSFRSAGPQNRLCDPCREYAADISPFDIWP